MKITNCNCGKLIDCGCTLSFDQYENNTISVLSVGNLVGGDCTIDDYVIDWYREGEYAFTSASDIGLTTPEATMFHPFYGSSAIPVIAGDYTPVVRFIVVDSVVLLVRPVKCKEWCDVDSDLPSLIVVNPLECGTTGGNPIAAYQFRMTFNYTQDWEFSSRTLRIYVGEYTKYIAIYFQAYQVADRIDVYMNEDSEVIQNSSYIVGSRFNTWQTATIPYKIWDSSAKFIIALPEYVAGSYLRVVITPSVLEANPLTNWDLSYKCLDDDLTSECNAFTAAMNEIDTNLFTMVNDVANCRWVFSSPMQYTGSYFASLIAPTLYTYINLIQSTLVSSSFGSFTTVWDSNTKIASVRMPYGRLFINQFFSNEGNFVTTAGVVTLEKTGDVFRWTFNEESDFNRMNNGYVAVLATNWDDNYSSDTADYNHYRYLRIQARYSDVGCGDPGYTVAWYYFHILSTVETGTDGYGKKYFQITAASITNGLTQIACDSAYTNANNIINQANSTKNLANFTATTRCTATGGMLGLLTNKNDTFTTLGYAGFGYRIYVASMAPHAMNRFCTPGRVGGSANSFYWFIFLGIKVEIKDQLDPANNYEISENVIEETGCTETTYNLIYPPS